MDDCNKSKFVKYAISNSKNACVISVLNISDSSACAINKNVSDCVILNEKTMRNHFTNAEGHRKRKPIGDSNKSYFRFKWFIS